MERDCGGFGVRRFLIFPISLRNVQSTTKISKNNIVQVGPGQAGIAQVGPQQVRPLQTGIGQVGPAKVGPGQVGLEQVGLGYLIGGSEIGAIVSAGATDFVASFFGCLANRMQGAAKCSLCGVWWVGFNQLPAENILRA